MSSETNPAVAEAARAINAAIRTVSDPETKAGLEKALVLVEQALPDLAGALEIVVPMLDDASGVVDAGEGEKYAYENELGVGRAAQERYRKMEYPDRDPVPVPGM